VQDFFYKIFFGGRIWNWWGVVWGEHGLEDFAQNLYKFGGMVGHTAPVLFSKNNDLEQLYNIGY